MRIAAVIVLLSSVYASAFNPGVYRSGKNRVVVKFSEHHEGYHVNIKTETNQFTCEFDHYVLETDEGSMQWHEQDCTVLIDQDDDSYVTIKQRGACMQYCGVGATLGIRRANHL